MSKYLDKLNKKLQVIKYLHKPNTRQKCADDLEIDERTIRNYDNEGDIVISSVVIPFAIKENRDGYSLSNSEYTEEDIKSNDLKLRSSVHPVILPLNLTEVYLLTSGILNNLGRNHPQYDAYKGIADKIYSQLSDYGKDRIRLSGHDFTDLRQVRYTSEEEMIEKDYHYNIGMAFKMGARVKITLIDDQCIYGKFEYRNTKMYIKQDNGEEIIFDNLGIKNIEIL